MLAVNSFTEIVNVVYGKRWKEFPTSKQEDILRMIDYWYRNGELTIGHPITPQDVLSALDSAFIERCSITMQEVLDGIRSKRNCDFLLIMYKNLADRCNSTPADIQSLINRKRTRPSIYFLLQKFDNYYRYDALFRSLYNDITKATDKYLFQSCQRES